MANYLFLLIALLAGCLVPLQGTINAHAGKLLKHPLQATFVSFLGGLLTVALLLVVIRPENPTRQQIGNMPWYTYTGGVLGVFFVTMMLMLMPKLGAASVVGAVIAGQLLTSVLFDHFGVMGLTRQPATMMRVAGVIFLFVGLYLISSGKSS